MITKSLHKIGLLLFFLAGLSITAKSQTGIANYNLGISSGTYTPITGTTVFSGAYDNSVSAAIPLGGTFTFGGAAVTTCYINTNGYISFGAASSSLSYTPLSTLGSTTGAVAGFAQDAAGSTVSGATPLISYTTVGSEFVVQYADHANYYNRSVERLNFQIRLNLTTGAINVIYGSFTNPGSVSTSGTTPQVGIRGNTVTWATNVNNLQTANIPTGTTCDWSNAVTGNANTSTMLFSSANTAIKPASGLTYTWTPQAAPAPVQTFAAVSAITSTGATIGWTAATGATQYNIQYRVPSTCSWTSFSGNPVTGTSAVLTGLASVTSYQVRIQSSNGTNTSIWSHIPTSASGTALNGYTTTGTFTTLANACTGTPATAVASGPSAVCASTSITLTATGLPTTTGITYQWQSSPAGAGTFTNITGATTVPYILAGQTAATDYQLVITCTNSSLTSNSNIVSVGQNLPGSCYCIPVATGDATKYISGFTTTGGTTNISNTPTGYSTNGYQNYSASMGASAGQTSTVNFTYELSTTGGFGVAIYIDYNQDGDFADAGEVAYNSYTALSGYNFALSTNGTFTVPATATLGTTRMRIVANYNNNNPTTDYCLTTMTGEFEDYAFTVLAPPACAVPTMLTATGITTTGATIGWTAPATGTPAGYNYEVRIAGLPGSGSPVASGSTVAPTISAMVSGLMPGTNYNLYVQTDCGGSGTSTWTGPLAFRTLLANDECAGAMMVPVSSTSTCGTVVSGTVLGATASTGPASACGTYDDDVWYSFVATSAIHTITLQNLAGSNTDLTFQVLDACGAPVARKCSDPQTDTISNLTIGNTYFLRVATYTSTGGQTSTFDVCITTPVLSYVSSTSTHPLTSSVAAGTTNVQILRIAVVTKGVSGTLNLTDLNLNTNGSTSAATDLTNAKVYYTGTSTTFATTTPFGTVITAPNGSFTISGTQALTGGLSNTTNYFWLVYDVPCNATGGDVIDAEVNSITVSGTPYTPTVTAPAGNRTITALAVTKADGNGTTAIPVGTQDATAANVLIPAVGTICPKTVNSITVNVNGTAASADITRAELFYTTTSTFSNAVQFGASIANPAAGTQVFTGTQVLSSTLPNYFWLVYDVDCAANTTANVNGDITAIDINGATVVPTGTAPAANNIAAASATYTTVADGSWNAPTTWICGAIPPTNATSVIINHNITVNTAGNIAGNLTINAGKSLTVASGDLTLGIAGGDKISLTNNGTLSVSGGSLNINGSLAVISGATFNQSAGNIIIDGNANGSIANSSTAVLASFQSASGSVTGGNITIVDPPASGTTRALEFNLTSGIMQWAPAHTVTFGDGVSTDASAGTVGFATDTYVGSFATQSMLGSVIVNGGSGANRFTSVTTSTLNGTFVKGNLTINSGSEFMQSTFGTNFTIAGNIINNGTFTSAGTVNLQTYTGSTTAASPNAQSIGGTGTFRNLATSPTANLTNLAVNNSSTGGVTLNVPVQVSGTLNMTSGNINTTAVNLLTVGISGIATGTIMRTGGMVVGPIKKWIAASAGSTTFPVGDGTNYRPGTINFTAAPSAGTLTARWSSVSPNFPNATPLVEGSITNINKACGSGSWFVDAADGLAGGSYTGTFTLTNAFGVIDYTKTVLLKRPSTGGDWILDGLHVATTGSNTTPVPSRTGMTGFSEFALGGENTVALPVTIQSITARNAGNVNIVNWTSVLETALDAYEVQRSADGRNFTTFTTQKAKGAGDYSATDNAPVKGINYYRLQIMNSNGTTSMSKVVTAMLGDGSKLAVSAYPNPATDLLNVVTNASAAAIVTMYDLTGRIVATHSVENGKAIFNMNGLAAGNYQVIVSDGGNTEVIKVSKQ